MAVPLPKEVPPHLVPAPPRAAIRPAELADLDALLDLENRCFDYDRLSRRSFRHFLASETAICLVTDDGPGVSGYALVLLHGRTSLARLYSMAVAPERQGAGLGRRLLEAAEAAALDGGAAIMRLEVRPDNAPAIELYRRAGYVEFGIYHGFYDDDGDALRMQRVLVPRLQPVTTRIPHYRQTLEFTCGPAALMMAMHALDSSVPLTRRLEIKLWRESTTIFMTSGHGGCGPHGLALAAWRRGFGIELFVNHERVPFLDTVRDPEKKEVLRLVHEEFVEEIRKTGIGVRHQPLTVPEVTARFAAGAMVLVLISQYRIYGDKEPHWIIVVGFDQRYIYVHDPYMGDHALSSTDCISIPISRREFELMARYGRSRLQAAVVLHPRPAAA